MIVEKLSNKYEKETNSVLYLGEDTGQDVVAFSPRAYGCTIQTQRRGKGMKRAYRYTLLHTISLPVHQNYTHQ